MALTRRLKINGASQEEIDFLLGEGDIGQRVELNAMTSDQFVAFVTEKLTAHGAMKVVPDAETLTAVHAAFMRGRRAKERLAAELKRIAAEEIPSIDGLPARVETWLAKHPTQTWDVAVRAIVNEQQDLVKNGGSTAGF
jgi:hypothetical protein